MSLLQSIREAVGTLLSRAQAATQLALRAVDWPASLEATPGDGGGGDEGRGGRVAGEGNEGGEEEGEEAGTCRGPATASPAAEAAAAIAIDSAATEAARQHQRKQQWVLLRFAAQDWLERSWAEWDLEAVLLLLVCAAFAAGNALSLLYMAAVAAGMALPATAQQVGDLGAVCCACNRLVHCPHTFQHEWCNVSKLMPSVCPRPSSLAAPCVVCCAGGLEVGRGTCAWRSAAAAVQRPAGAAAGVVALAGAGPRRRGADVEPPVAGNGF